MDTNIVVNIIIGFFQFIAIIVATFSVYFLSKTIKNTNKLNQKNIFNEVVKQERELRIKLSEYREEINKRMDLSKDFNDLTLSYDTLLFNYYEYLAICLYQKIISESAAKLYFKDLLNEVADMFESSILFKEEYAKKEQYKGIQWLFKRWNI